MKVIIAVIVILLTLFIANCRQAKKEREDIAPVAVYAEDQGSFYGDSIRITDRGCILYQGKDSMIFSYFPIIISKRKPIE